MQKIIICHITFTLLLILGGILMLASFIGRDEIDYKLFNAGFCMIFICILYLLFHLLDIIFNCSNCLCSYYYKDEEQKNENRRYSSLDSVI
jgi:hypothetical protein